MSEYSEGIKIYIMTMHAVQNYGSVLQAYATQEVLKKYNMNVKIINYIREDCKAENLMYSWSKGNIIKNIVIYPTLKRWEKIFGKFRKDNLNLTDEIYSSSEDFQKLILDADIYCTGSDQVWNSKWNQGIEYPLYLSFVPKEGYKISFASSFGRSKLEEREINATKKYIWQYKYISVREEDAVKIIREQYGYDRVFQLIDPTLMLSSHEWKKFSLNDQYRGLKGNYMLVYNLNRSQDFDKYAKKLANKAGIKLVRLCTRFDQFYKSGKSIFIPEVKDFINLIANARYVLTDSFHATAFSMNLNTEPICVYPNEFSGRIQSLLQLLDCEQRHVRSYSDFDIVNRKVDFKKVNKILENERNKVADYITMIIDSAKNYYGL